MAQIDQFLKVLVEQQGSDLHLTVGSPPVMRVHGTMQRLKFRELTEKDMETLVFEIMEEDWRIKFVDRLDYDFAYEIEGLARFRVNVFWQRKGLGAVLRTIPSRIRTADELELPEAIRRMCMLTKGLVLVTGPTGLGQEHDARRHGRPDQRDARGPRAHHRGPDRVRAREQEVPGQPARGEHQHEVASRTR